MLSILLKNNMIFIVAMNDANKFYISFFEGKFGPSKLLTEASLEKGGVCCSGEGSVQFQSVNFGKAIMVER